MTHVKQQKLFLTSNIYETYIIAILLRNSPMVLHANSRLISMDCYISDSVEIHSKAYGFMRHRCYNNIRPMLKALFVRATDSEASLA